MSKPLLLDTSIASLLHQKKVNDPLRAVYGPDLEDREVAISFQTAAELYLCAENNHWGPRPRAELDLVLDRIVIVYVDRDLIRVWSSLQAECRRIGRRLEAADAWVIATAKRHELALVTHDRDMLGLAVGSFEVLTHLK